MALFGKQFAVTYKPVGIAEAVDGEPPAPQRGDFNLDNILRLVPSDIVAIYLIAKGVTSGPVLGFPWPAFAFWACILVCVLLRMVATTPGAGIVLREVNWTLVGVTAVAFFIWAHAVSDVGPVIESFRGAAAGIIAALFGVVAPRLVPGVPDR